MKLGRGYIDLVLQLLPALFLTILFIQSGLDKVTDRKGNLDWLTGHFSKSPFAGFVPLLLTALTVLELTAGSLSGLGVLQLAFARDTTLALWGAIVSGVAVVALFLGQRLAKDYAGAASLAPYFLVTLAAIAFLR